MKADPKRKPDQSEYDRSKRARRHQEEALDDALKNTFPASDPFSIEQPGTAGHRQGKGLKRRAVDDSQKRSLR